MYKKISLAYDGSPEYRAALRQGVGLAAFCDAEVHLLAIYRPHATTPIAYEVLLADLVNEEQQNIRDYLEDGVDRLRKRGIKAEGRLGNHRWDIGRHGRSGE